MNDNALAVANYFIDLAHKEGKPITLLGLIKRVYIAHGFSLAIFHKSLLDPRFDKVEAWRYGPVIPCVYHSFKQFRANPITEKTEVMEWNENDYTPTFHAPELKDEDAKKIEYIVFLIPPNSGELKTLLSDGSYSSYSFIFLFRDESAI